MTVTATRTQYRGTWFRSTLEADWAATFDELGWHWEYEPVSVKLSSGEHYRPDFYLPSQTVWCEVKGPHNERLVKAKELQKAVEYDQWQWSSPFVVVLRPPGPGEKAMWEGAVGEQEIVIIRCPECLHHGFMDYAGTWSCRRHMRVVREPNKFWQHEEGGLWYSGEMPFTRAPKNARKGS